MAVSSYFRSIPEIFADAANRFSILVRRMISRFGGGSADMMRRILLASLFVLIATASLCGSAAGESGGCRRLYESALGKCRRSAQQKGRSRGEGGPVSAIVPRKF
jgi:hypothetical protein